MRVQAGTLLVTLFLANAVAAQFIQQGGKLFGTGAVGAARQGSSVALSADGNTAIIGGMFDNSGVGAAWVYTRSGGVWSQQGGKLVGTGAVEAAQQGYSVAISADGNTAIVGAVGDNSSVGAAWVYTRTAGVWSQQGPKLVGTGVIGVAEQGVGVAISADGNTAVVGGWRDNSDVGATWVYTRSGGVWSQQGNKLIGTGAVGAARQGGAVAISADGNTAILTGDADDSSAGATWVYTRSGGVWTQQGSKLVGTGATGAAQQGWSAGISADGNTAIVGGIADASGVGASWVFTRSGGVWSQQGSKLVGTVAVGADEQGDSVGISADGNTAIVGGFLDNSGAGASWVFTRSGGVWSQLGSKLVGVGAVGVAQQGVWVAISADGTTALVGGFTDDSLAGASWVFVSSATQLAFVQQPTTTVAGQPIAPAVSVQLQDGGGIPVAQGGVTITLSLSSGTGSLGGTLSQVTNASGLATFNDLSINPAGSKQLTAANAGRTSAVSSAFFITAGAATSFFATGGTPQSAPILTLFAQPLQVTVTDSFGNPVAGALVTYGAPASGPSASLSNGGSATTDATGRASVTATANGVAGGPYLVNAATGALPPVSFTLTNAVGPVAKLVFGQQPTNAVAGEAIAPSVAVQLQDSGSNPVSQAGVLVTLALASGTGTLSGTATQPTDTSGVATFAGLSVNLVGTKTLAASSVGLTSATSGSFLISAGVATSLAVSGGNAQTAMVRTAFANPLSVLLTDALGNAVPGGTVVFVAPGLGPSAALTGSPATTNTSGVASVTATANAISGTYSVTATYGTLPPLSFTMTNAAETVATNNVPTLGTMGLALFALALSMVGVLVVRRVG